MALAIPSPPNDRKRVKVYELRENDWYDRGTGFCTGQITDDEAKILVESEDQPDRMLLETSISKEDGYQKQQDTLIVWTDVNGVDMALSFQEAEGCAAIWEFVRHIQQQLTGMSQDDSLSDDAFETVSNPITLPQPELGNLAEVEQLMRAAGATQVGRDAVSKFIIRDDYIMKLLPLVSIAEDLESLPDLHRLCNIMKSLILLNDNAIIELVVSDDVINGVVGALEYDPEFPTHKANHRQYLNDRNRFKEVVPIKDPVILRKIRHTWRLQYLKDVVLARILDDPTFSVLNSLIFFNQVDIVQHLQENTAFLEELFGLFSQSNTDHQKRDDAVRFIHQCASIAKTLQAPARANLFTNFIHHGLFTVINYAIGHPNPSMRTTGIDILVVLLDHDPLMMRGHMLKAVSDKQVPLTDTLINLLHVEPDLGVKNQLADALKVLLDPSVTFQDLMNRGGMDFISKLRTQNSLIDPSVVKHFEESARKLFWPLKQLESRTTLNDFTFQEVALYSHLVDILTFFVRQHTVRSRGVLHEELLAPRVAQLLTAPQKHLKLVALKFFRTLVGSQDTFYTQQLTHSNTLELILNIVYESMPRDNLLNSACLELFEYVKRETIKPIIVHLVEKYRDKLTNITYVDTFQNIILRYDQMQGYAGPEGTLFSQDDSSTGASPPQNIIIGGHRWHGIRGMDAAEEEYFDASDDDEAEVGIFSSSEEMMENVEDKVNGLMRQYQQGKQHAEPATAQNGPTPSSATRPLVSYPDDDEEDEIMAIDSHDGDSTSQAPPRIPQTQTEPAHSPDSSPLSASSVTIASQRYAEKRRREQDEDDDELVKLSSQTKRRSSSVSSVGSGSSIGGSPPQRKNSPSATGSPDRSASAASPAGPGGPGTGKKKIAINLNASTGIKLTLKNPNTKNRNNGSGPIAPDAEVTSHQTEDRHGGDDGGGTGAG